VITGFYAGSGNAMHAYVRAADGKITTFDAPGAASTGGQTPFPTVGASPGTYAVGMDTSDAYALLTAQSPRSGAITGYYVDASGAYHGFVRK